MDGVELGGTLRPENLSSSQHCRQKSKDGYPRHNTLTMSQRLPSFHRSLGWALPSQPSSPPSSTFPNLLTPLAHLILIQHEQLVPRDDAEPRVPTRTIIRGMNVLGSVHRGSPYIWGTETHSKGGSRLWVFKPKTERRACRWEEESHLPGEICWAQVALGRG